MDDGRTVELDDPAEGVEAVGQADWLGMVLDDRFRLIEQVGIGGMGTVYRAEHLRLGRDVAIKLVRVPSSDDRAFKQLEREARSVALIGHENIIRAIDFGWLEIGAGYLALEYLEGETLAQRVARVGPLPLSDACSIMIQTASALEAAHVRGVVHRDVTPSNVFLCNEHQRRDVVKVLDFGLASMRMSNKSQTSAPTHVAGTPGFIAPEMIIGEQKVDGRADVFSLGASFYFSLCGSSPFAADSLREGIRRLVHEPEIPISRIVDDLPLAPRVDRLLERALAKDPADRLPSADAFRLALIEIRRTLERPVRRRQEQEKASDPPGLAAWVAHAGDVIVVELAGDIDGEAALDDVRVRIDGPSIELWLGGVRRIDTEGCRRWKAWLDALAADGAAVTIHDCAPVLVRLASADGDLFRGHLVHSIQAPYRCGRCQWRTKVALRAEAVQNGQLDRPVCRRCNGLLALDEVEHTYLRCLRPESPAT